MVLRGKAALAVVVVALGIAAASVAYAAIPDGVGMIHGCYKNGNGQLRVVNEAGDCTASEIAIDWSRSGPPGARGRRETRATPETSPAPSRARTTSSGSSSPTTASG